MGIIPALIAIYNWVSTPVELVLKVLRAFSPFKSVTLCLNYRSWAKETYFKKAFSSRSEVLIVSLMSEHTVKEIEPLLAQAQATNTRVRALTWSPDSPEITVESLRKHLGENEVKPELTLRQVAEARERWAELHRKYQHILQAACYKSSPTMGAIIVKNRWALIELLPYHVHTSDRPALVLSRWKDRKAFDF